MRNRHKGSDRVLGLHRPITRRDFIQGSLVSAAMAGWTRELFSAPQAYPPALTGLRGSHPGAFEIAHALRDGQRWADAKDTGERYDLIVVGGGISGLAAANFYRARSSSAARILILENHDDFGGHARRNEFRLGQGVQLMNGGTWAIESPRPYSAMAAGLLKSVGIDVEALAHSLWDEAFYDSLGLREAVFLDRETFGFDKLFVLDDNHPWEAILGDTPLSEAVRRDIQRIESSSVDYLPGLSSEQKKARLSRMSYRDFLLNVARVDPGVCKYYQARTHDLWCVGIDAVSALDCWALEFPGFQGMELKPGSAPRMGFTAAKVADHGWSKAIHFPDGNATVARAILRTLIPEAAAGKSIQDLVEMPVDYSQLDRPGAAVRLRLDSTVVQAQNVSSSGVAVTYVRGGAAFKAHARHCVLACWNAVIPYLCPELPARQKEALRKPTKTPMVYTSVALRNWRPFEKLGVMEIHAPGSYFSSITLNESVRIGRYATARNPDEPMLIRLNRMPCAPGLPEREQNRAGRAELLATPFETFERHLRDLLARALARGGFDPARDITAITVNRWPHGYAHEFNPLFDEHVPEAQQPHVIGRARLGGIAIANSDAAAAAYTDAAIDEAHRSVRELLGG